MWLEWAKRIGVLALRICLALLLASCLYLVPIWGSHLLVPVYLLPDDHGVTAMLDADLGPWVAAQGQGFLSIDIELELTMPEQELALQRGGFRLDLEVGSSAFARPLVPPRISTAAKRIRDLLLAPPMALGLCYDEQTIRLPITSGLPPSDLVGGDVQRLRVSPALVAREAHLRLSPRPAGKLGDILSSFFGFVPLCAIGLFLGPLRWRRASGSVTPIAASPARQAGGLSFVEAQMLAKALGGGVVSGVFPETLAACEAEDRKSAGEVDLSKLKAIVEAHMGEWRAALEQEDVHRLVAEALELSPTDRGIVCSTGRLRYRVFLAVAAVAAVCGSRPLSDYAQWIASDRKVARGK